MAHVRHLASAIGPRGSTTPQERQAAEYAAATLERLGLAPRVEPFTSTVSGWRPFAVAALFALACTLLFLIAGPLLAALLALALFAVTLSVFLEMYFRPNLLRAFVRKGRSQNVWAAAPAAGEARRRLLLVAHLDTHRTPWAFTSPRRLAFFKLMTTLGVVAFVLTAGTFFAYAVTFQEWLRWLAPAFVPVHLVVLALTWQPDATPYTAGANDNASGVGVLLSLAGRLVAEPLAHTEVWLLASGCEEVGSVGMQAFVDAHGEALRNELGGALGISIDNVGGRGAGVCYTSVEGMVFPLRPSPELFALAEELKGAHPELHAYSRPYTTLHTDATCLMANRIPALSFVGLTPDGEIPDWHQASDVVANVDAGTVAATHEFVWRLMRRFDADAAGRA
jgi:acetylornithine deacetylase/succinyl-diaminopimelate desuccinylase-like protein